MNILIIPAFFRTKNRPTLGSFFWEQAVALQRAGHKVAILYCDTYSVKCAGEWLGYSEERVSSQGGILIYRKKLFCPLKHGMEGYREQFTKGILHLYEQFAAEGGSAELIHAHCCVWAGYAAMKLSEKINIPYVITEHATMFQLHRDKINEANNQCIAQVFQNASGVICVSKAFGRLISEYRAEDEIDIVGNVVDCAFFRPAEQQKKNSISFLTVCYMQTEDQLYKKGIDLLLKAWADIAKKYPDARLVLGGGGQAVSKALEWCEDYGISDSVTFPGALDRNQVAEQMQQCDCFVLPSRYETFGVVYIEAMACGKPVIAAANGGPDDFVKEFNGILIKPEQKEALVQALEQMIASVNTSDSPYDVEKIVSYVQEKFSYEAIAGQLEEVYRRII